MARKSKLCKRQTCFQKNLNSFVVFLFVDNIYGVKLSRPEKDRGYRDCSLLPLIEEGGLTLSIIIFK